MKKVNKTQARKLFNKGVTLFLLPSKVGFNNCWISPYRLNINECENEKDFDKIVNAYSYYNCNTDLGKIISYYVED